MWGLVESLEGPWRSLTHLHLFPQLAAVCDVFVENYVPGKLSAMGLGYEDIDKIAPHIIYCSITGICTPHPPQWVDFSVIGFLYVRKKPLASVGFPEVIPFSLALTPNSSLKNINLNEDFHALIGCLYFFLYCMSVVFCPFFYWYSTNIYEVLLLINT